MEKLEDIVNFKVKVGCSSDDRNVVIAITNDYVGAGAGVSIAHSLNQYYYLSFEHSSLLFMNADNKLRLTGEYKIIPINLLASIQFKKEKFHLFNANGNSPLGQVALMITANDGDKIHLSVQKHIVYRGGSWVSRNLRYVENLIGS